MQRCTPLLLMICLLFTTVVASGARGESKILLPYPSDIGIIAAGTFNDGGKRVGQSSLSIRHIDEDHLQIEIDMQIDEGARNHVEATLETVTNPTSGERALRILREQSQSFLSDGTPLVLLQVDHEGGKASCTPSGGQPSDAVVIPLPSEDRVVNVPLNNRLQAIELPALDAAALQMARETFESRWIYWNAFRTVFGLLTTALLLAVVYF